MAFLSLDEIKRKGSYSEVLLLDERHLAAFMALSRDTAAIHVATPAAQEKGFADRVVHGFLSALPFSRMLGMELPGENTVIGSLQLEFHNPVYVGDTVQYTVTVARILAPLGTVALDLRAVKSDRSLCIEGKSTCVFKTGARR